MGWDLTAPELWSFLSTLFPVTSREGSRFSSFTPHYFSALLLGPGWLRLISPPPLPPPAPPPLSSPPLPVSSCCYLSYPLNFYFSRQGLSCSPSWLGSCWIAKDGFELSTHHPPSSWPLECTKPTWDLSPSLLSHLLGEGTSSHFPLLPSSSRTPVYQNLRQPLKGVWNLSFLQSLSCPCS